ncbi:VOC family protein [Roseibium litorale]|uniref:VOC family protein n=1 Tax=Roseibium litorale TaxID=2803841 RepID=A0ABR9CPP6_9HYPH|nr:VOC family protein [Roseibium litorale]MBD8892644.1 VOC family protein [Roseibium litorale]
MIDHISIGVRDLVRAKVFYDAALTPLGYRCIAQNDASLGYGAETVSFWVLAADVPVPANDASGLHICFASPSQKSVDAFHAAALEHGGRDNGVPGLRKDYDANYYAAFVRDPDGYRIEAYCGSTL